MLWTDAFIPVRLQHAISSQKKCSCLKSPPPYYSGMSPHSKPTSPALRQIA